MEYYSAISQEETPRLPLHEVVAVLGKTAVPAAVAHPESVPTQEAPAQSATPMREEPGTAADTAEQYLSSSEDKQGSASPVDIPSETLRRGRFGGSEAEFNYFLPDTRGQSQGLCTRWSGTSSWLLTFVRMSLRVLGNHLAVERRWISTLSATGCS